MKCIRCGTEMKEEDRCCLRCGREGLTAAMRCFMSVRNLFICSRGLYRSSCRQCCEIRDDSAAIPQP